MTKVSQSASVNGSGAKGNKRSMADYKSIEVIKVEKIPSSITV
jgi:hypothetical protein